MGKNNATKNLLVFLGILSILIIFLIEHKTVGALLLGYDGQNFMVHIDNQTECVKGWEKEGIIYFFLPAYMKRDELCWENEKTVIRFADNEIEQKKYKIPWDEVWNSEVVTKEGEVKWTGAFCFLSSENLPAMHIEMKDEELAELLEDKEVRLPATIKLINNTGGVLYQSELEYLTGRGNSTWGMEKKPFIIKLRDSIPLLGMDAGKSWVLLANAYEGTKIAYKMTLDIAREMGIPYTSDSRWIDLYVNGDYFGNYLLTEKLEVGAGRIEIEDLKTENERVYGESVLETYREEYTKGYDAPVTPENATGGYLIEKDTVDYYWSEICGFATRRGYTFSLKSPSNASRQEMRYICGYIQTIDDMMEARDETVMQFIDKDSFFKKYLLDEIALNSDANVTSAYFFKKKDDNTLYSGPPWDYDGVFGESGDVWMDYTQTVLDVDKLRCTEKLSLDWNNAIFEISDNETEIESLYKEIRPIYEEMLINGIDSYKALIDDSVEMDMVRWNYGAMGAGYYDNYDNTIRYLKYFLTKRLQWMDEKFNTVGHYPELEKTEEIHNVSVYLDDEVITIAKKDGDCIRADELPTLSDNLAYHYVRDGRTVSFFLPVYEDLEICVY